MFLNLVAALVTVLTFVVIIRGMEVRLALLAAGAILALASLNMDAWFEAFTRSMTTAGLISVILPVMGFATVVKLTGCDRHLVKLIVDPLLKLRPVMVPAAMLATFVINMALTSAAGVTAAVGVVLIPAMMAAGIHPAMAGAAVFAGSWGSIFSPGSPHPALIAKIANVSVVDVIFDHKWASMAAALIVAAILFVEAKLFKQDRDWTPERAGAKLPDSQTKAVAPLERANVMRAMIPMLPLVLLLVTAPQLGLTTTWLPKGMSVLQAMVVGVVLAMLVTRTSPTEASNKFFTGMGEAYGSVIGIIIAAGVFIGGLEASGAIGALIEWLKDTQSAAPIFATFGPYFLAVLSGSGDAATLAFNNAVTPHAAALGMTPLHLGNLAWIGGALGRTMSPVAAACVVAAGFAGVSPFELAKRNAVPMLAAAVAAVLILGL